ncbi:MAG: hypothetical protein KatS3mg101_0928 [Patescibacteria group bacterium]|nr:MAG: hypothetical protein KatS3mg101_0928 [Patescibacteria group bacterium]
MTAHNIDYRFRCNIVALLSILEDTIIERKINIDVRLIRLIKVLLEEGKMEGLVEKFIRSTYGYWDDIREKSTDFIKENSIVDMLFDKITDDKLEIISVFCGRISRDELRRQVEEFRSLFNSLLDSDDEVWRILHGCVRLSIKYIDICGLDYDIEKHRELWFNHHK